MKTLRATLIALIVLLTSVTPYASLDASSSAPSSTAAPPKVENKSLFTGAAQFTAVTAAGLTAWINQEYAQYSPLLIAFGETSKNFWDMMGIFKPCCTPAETFSHFSYPSLIEDKLKEMNGISAWVIRELLEWMHLYHEQGYIQTDVKDNKYSFSAGGVTLTMQKSSVKQEISAQDSDTPTKNKKSKEKGIKKDKGKEKEEITKVKLKEEKNNEIQEGVDKNIVKALASESFFRKILPNQKVKIIMAALANGSIQSSSDETQKKYVFTFMNFNQTKKLLDFIVEGVDDGSLIGRPQFSPNDSTRKGVLAFSRTFSAWGWAIPIALDPSYLEICACGYFITRSVIGNGVLVYDKVKEWRQPKTDEVEDFFESCLKAMPYINGLMAEIFLEVKRNFMYGVGMGNVKIKERNRNFIEFELLKYDDPSLKGSRFTLNVMPPDNDEEGIQIVNQEKLETMSKVSQSLITKAFKSGQFGGDFIARLKTCLDSNEIELKVGETTHTYNFKSCVSKSDSDNFLSKKSVILSIGINAPNWRFDDQNDVDEKSSLKRNRIPPEDEVDSTEKMDEKV